MGRVGFSHTRKFSDSCPSFPKGGKMNNDFDMVYITKIRTWLTINDRTKSWLARQCNVSPAAVNYWIEGKTNPSKKHNGG